MKRIRITHHRTTKAYRRIVGRNLPMGRRWSIEDALYPWRFRHGTLLKVVWLAIGFWITGDLAMLEEKRR